MAATIFEAILNAEINAKNGGIIWQTIGRSQLHNAAVLIEKGYGLDDHVEPLLEKYGDVESVPDKGE